MLENIKINPEFERLIPPLVNDEFEMLEKNILSEGEVYTPLFVWNDFIIDGHHRFKIISKYPNTKFSIVKKDFENKYEAISWMCNNQLGRRNLTPENRKYLIGKRYEAEKMSHGGTRRGDDFSSDQFGHLKNGKKTRKKIAEETKTSEGYVARAENFAKGVDAADEVIPGIKEEILSGKIKKTADEIAAIAKAPQEERRSLTENLRLTKVYDKKPANFNQNIKSIAADMRDLDTPVTDESVLETLEGTVEMFIESCDTTFVNHPNILVDEDNFQKVLKILDKANQFIKTIKGDKK